MLERSNEKRAVLDRIIQDQMPVPHHILNPEVYMIRSMEYDNRVQDLEQPRERNRLQEQAESDARRAN